MYFKMNINNKLINVKSVYKEFQNNTNFKIIDVRFPEEFKDEHIKKSINIPLDQIKNGIKNTIPDKNATIYTFCRSGERSSMAQAILKSMGYKNVKNVSGGILEWKEQNLPTIK